MKNTQLTYAVHSTLGEVIQEWDDIAEYRYEQLSSGKDISYRYVLKPALINTIAKYGYTWDNILDVGCGVGVFTGELSSIATRVYGLDPSSKSIKIAKKHNRELHNICFYNETIEDHISTTKYHLIVSNMALMDILDLEKALNSISNHLKNDSYFIFTITHPFFWPQYWQYNNEKWFNYKEEITIRSKFRITLDNTINKVTTHVHRPVEFYFNQLSSVGLCVLDVKELCDPEEVSNISPNRVNIPRFLLFVCKKRV